VATTLLIARHGETDWNREERWQGHADRPLNDLGRLQARALGKRLRASSLDVVYSSDLARARETAEIVCELLRLDMHLDTRLREVDVGEWSGLSTAEIERLYPEGLQRRRLGGTGWEHGESFEAMSARVVEALQEIKRANPTRRVLVVTHGGPMRAVWLVSSGEASAWQGTANCDVNEIALEDGRIRWIDSVRVGGLHQQVQG
jgi:broad specificity phosphatase PhoE